MQWLSWLLLGDREIIHILRRMETKMATQSDIDSLNDRLNAVSDRLNDGISDIRDDIKNLKDNNPSVDTSALEATVARLEGVADDVSELDAENPGTDGTVPPPDGTPNLPGDVNNPLNVPAVGVNTDPSVSSENPNTATQ